MTLADQCVKRVCSFEHRKAWGDLTNASVPAGTLVPAGGRREFDNLAMLFAWQSPLMTI
jgi:hypothetical protein